ncbi:Ribonuclease H-like protein, partial [Macrophomina phaseolina MS6]
MHLPPKDALNQLLRPPANSMASKDVSLAIPTPTTAPTGVLPSTNPAGDGGGRGLERQDWGKFPWSRYPGYLVSGEVKRTGWTWSHGYDIKHETTGKRRWVCWHCVEDGSPPADYMDSGTENHGKHLAKEHGIPDPAGKHNIKKRAVVSVAQQLQLSAKKPEEQAILNRLIRSFNPAHFQELLMDWIAHDNIPFRKVESERFRCLLEYTNPQVASTGCLPSHPTIRKWLLGEFNRHKGVVTEVLHGAPGLIHLSFDGWSSRNRLSLLGLNVHFLSSSGKVRQFLIGLPKLEGRHTGVNLAEEVARVIAEWDIGLKIGYFITDNADNNDACLEALAKEHGFNVKWRRLRCCGHIINLV